MTVRPAALVVQRARWGQVAHRAPKRAVPRLLARGLIVAVFPAGQVTVRAVVSMAKSPRR